MRTPDADADVGHTAGQATVVVVATVAIGLGAAIGFLYGYLAVALRSDLGLSRGQVGLLVGLYFGSTGLGSIGGGVIVDRMGARLAVVANLVTVSAVAGLIVLLDTYLVLLVASVVAGLAYSLGNAGTNMAIGVAVAPANRGLALTIKTGGVPAMATIAALTAPWAAARIGWQPIIGVVGVLAGLVACGAMLLLPTDRPQRATSRSGVLPSGFYWFPVASFLLVAGSQPLFSWSVSWLEEVHDTSVGAAGALSAVATASGVVGMVLVGRRSDVLGSSRRTTVIAVMAAVCSVGTVGLAIGARVTLASGVVALSVATATQLGAIGVMHAAVVDAAPQAIGRGSGVTMTGYYLGALISPTAFGWLVDITGDYGAAWAACALALIGSALAFSRAGKRPLPAESTVW
ncbi:MFS transporter [Euzebya tangerina]|uniref:MFS transporter n=1 Tax=Euzebya tangerina TaxID=591198 RepID=UPI000E3128B8|nr:MFS transporter [Euzebya tangerina]